MLLLFVFFIYQGYYCVRGSKRPSQCLNGTYQDELGQGSCKDCPAGYYCDASSAPVVSYNDTECPAGKRHFRNRMCLVCLEKRFCSF